MKAINSPVQLGRRWGAHAYNKKSNPRHMVWPFQMCILDGRIKKDKKDNFFTKERE